MTQLVAERLEELLLYEPETGNFIRRTDRGGYRAGSIAGWLAKTGYIQLNIDGQKYYAHRLAFLYMDGEFPPEYVDHINKDKTDNKWRNLRPVTQRQNMENASHNNKVIGVSRGTTKGTWRAARARNGGQTTWIGTYKSFEEACLARAEWEREDKIERGNI